LNQNYQIAGYRAADAVERRHVQIEEAACRKIQAVVEQLERQMIAHIVEVRLVDHVSDFVQLNAGLLRVRSGPPADVDDDHAFVCGVDEENDGERNASSALKQRRNVLVNVLPARKHEIDFN
jgi:hypothetical protein